MASLSLSLLKPRMVKASASPTTTLSVPETLDEQFGIQFIETNNIPFVGMPDAYVPSYKPILSWKEDAFEEVPFTVPADGADPTKTKGNSSIEKHGVIWKQKDVPLNILKQKFSPAYAASPEQRLNTSHFVTPHLQNMKLSSGCKPVFRVIRIGFEDIHAYSVLAPCLKMGESWRGVQVIQHDNL
ncbi:hypothetical protein SLA2020_095950 [Shorea laevis]